jgi:hypothetical protein
MYTNPEAFYVNSYVCTDCIHLKDIDLWCNWHKRFVSRNDEACDELEEKEI